MPVTVVWRNGSGFRVSLALKATAALSELYYRVGARRRFATICMKNLEIGKELANNIRAF